MQTFRLQYQNEVHPVWLTAPREHTVQTIYDVSVNCRKNLRYTHSTATEKPLSKILIAEDDEMTRNVIAHSLKMERHTVEAVGDGESALEYLLASSYDVVILDLGLPGKDGVDVCQEYRRHGGTAAVLMLTGRNAASQKIEGLDSGADDYLTKPCDMQELAARVRALLRRSGAKVQTGDVLKVGDLSLDRRQFRAQRSGKSIDLIAKEFAILELLMRSPGIVFSHDAILDRVWTTDEGGTSESLRTHIKNLRKKLEIDGAPDPIKTVHRVGYKLDFTAD